MSRATPIPQADEAESFVTYWIQLAINRSPDPEREYFFLNYRFDFAWPEQRVYVEIDGGTHSYGGGRHAHDGDKEKRNAAILAGWIGLHYSPEMLHTDPDKCISEVLRLLETRR